MEKLKPLSQTTLTLPPQAARFLPWAAAFAAGLCLSGAAILGIHLPAAVCLTAALGATGPGLMSWLGSAAGCLFLWDTEFTLLTLTTGFLALVLHWALQEMPLAKRLWFPTCSALVPGAVISVFVLLSGPVTAKAIIGLGVQLTALTLGTWATQNALEHPTGSPLCAALFALVSGCSAIAPADVPLGGVLAGWAVFSLGGTSLAVPAAVLTGLALDWNYPADTSCVAVLSTAAMAAAALRRKNTNWQLLGFLLTAGSVGIVCGGGGALFLSLLLGSAAARLLPPLPVEEPSRLPEEAARNRLLLAARAMDAVYCRLEDVPSPDPQLEISDIYDKATSRVCAACAGFSGCWKQNSVQTREAFLAAAEGIFRRRSARFDDFPEEFRTNCRHFPKLLSAISAALEQDADRRQRDRHRRELRSVMGSQYRILSDFLRLNVLPRGSEKPLRFAPDTACLVRGKGAQPVSGDRCISFRQGTRQYLLLCDGMGSGAGAADDSRQAEQLLTSLLKAGMEPEDALETLGAMAILAEDGGFCAMDLAWVSLVTGEGVLYKWGGGPSFLRTAGKTKKVGTATLPPGIGVGGTHMARQVRLSLGRGDVLVLTSDGVDGEVVRRLLAAAEGLQAKDLAAGILAQDASEGEDDRSAAVLMLHPASAR